jgi:hypothetical protein
MEYCACGALLNDPPHAYSPDGIHCGVCFDLLHGTFPEEQVRRSAEMEEGAIHHDQAALPQEGRTGRLLQKEMGSSGLASYPFRDANGAGCYLQQEFIRQRETPHIYLGPNRQPMVLDQNMVGELISLLQHFFETGALE